MVTPHPRLPDRARTSVPRVSSACSSGSSPARRLLCGTRCRSFRKRRATGRESTTWRSPRFTRPGSCCSTTTRDCCSRRASTARGTPTWRTSSRRGRPWRSSTSSSSTSTATTGCLTSPPSQSFVLGAQVTAAAYARNYGGTVKEIRKAERVNTAFQQVLDDPEAAEALQHPALKPLLDEAAD